MQYQGAAVILDVKTRLPYQKRGEITSDLRDQDGIRDAEFSQYVDRVMIISYDPKVISAQGIRNRVQARLETDGPATCLVDL